MHNKCFAFTERSYNSTIMQEMNNASWSENSCHFWKENQDSVGASNSLQNAFHAISKQYNTFKDTITALQW